MQPQAPAMPPPPMGSAPGMPGVGPPPMGLFGALSALAKKGRNTPMDDMRSAIKLLESVRELDPDKTGKNVSLALSVLRNGPETLSDWNSNGA